MPVSWQRLPRLGCRQQVSCLGQTPPWFLSNSKQKGLPKSGMQRARHCTGGSVLSRGCVPFPFYHSPKEMNRPLAFIVFEMPPRSLWQATYSLLGSTSILREAMDALPLDPQPRRRVGRSHHGRRMAQSMAWHKNGGTVLHFMQWLLAGKQY